MTRLDEPISVDYAIDESWRGRGEPVSYSESLSKIYVKVAKEPTPTDSNAAYLIRNDERYIPAQPEIGLSASTVKTSYFWKIGDLLSAAIEIASEFPESDDDNIIIKVAEISFEPTRVSQYVISDIFLLNVLEWILTIEDDSDDSDSDSDSDRTSDSDSDSDSDPGSDPPPYDSDSDSDS